MFSYINNYHCITISYGTQFHNMPYSLQVCSLGALGYTMWPRCVAGYII